MSAQVLVVWHCVQLKPYLPLCTAGSAWHDTHDVGVPWNVSFLWHDLQSTAKCLPVSGKRVTLWSKFLKSTTVVAVHVAVEWHDLQSRPNLPLCTCGSAWHDTHVDGVSL